MLFTAIFKKKTDCFVVDVELGSLEREEKRPKDRPEKKNKENGEMENTEERYV
jgi:hypothetical protein